MEEVVNPVVEGNVEMEIKNEESQVVPEKVETPVVPEVKKESPVIDEGRHIPYDRFKEVNDERKQYLKELSELRQQLTERKAEASPKKMSTFEKFKAKGYDDDSAKALAEVFEDEIGSRLKPIEEQIASERAEKQMSKAVAEFQKSHKDFGEYEERMNDIFMKLDNEMKQTLVASPAGLEFLYAKARMEMTPDLMEKAKETVARDKKAKQEGASLKGASTGAKTKFTQDMISKMSSTEFAKHEAEIDEALRKGEIE